MAGLRIMVGATAGLLAFKTQNVLKEDGFKIRVAGVVKTSLMEVSIMAKFGSNLLKIIKEPLEVGGGIAMTHQTLIGGDGEIKEIYIKLDSLTVITAAPSVSRPTLT